MDDDLIGRLPKAELHLHLEGSLEPELMFELAARNGIHLPWDSVAAVRTAYRFTGLQSFLDLYYAGSRVLVTRRDFHDLTAAYLRRAAADNVTRAEVFLGPQSFTERGTPIADVLGGTLAAIDAAAIDAAAIDAAAIDTAAIDRAAGDGAAIDAGAGDRAAGDGAATDGGVIDGAAIDGAASDGAAIDGAASDGAAGDGAAIDAAAGGRGRGVSAGLIVSAQRHRTEEAAFELLDAVQPWGERILGFGLGGAERGNPPGRFARFFAECRRQGFRTTAHAGEEGPAAYVREAVEVCEVDRIDHGIACLDDPYLVDLLRERQIPLTVCPISNVKLNVVDDIAGHPLRRLLDAGLLVTVNSDDPSYFGGYLNDNYRALNLTDAEAETLAANGFRAAFGTP